MNDEELLSHIYRNEALTARGFDGYRQKHDQFKLGAIAELIDNAMEAQSTKVMLNIDEATGILEVLDDGVGVPRKVVKTMVIAGRGNKKSKNNYGVGFKCGSLGIGNDVLVLSKTVECNCGVYFKVIQGEDVKCTCAKGERRHVRSLIYLTAGSRLEGDDDSLQIPMIFWRGDGKALVTLEDLKEMPEQEERGISDAGVSHLIKFVCTHFHLHTLKAIQTSFDRIKGKTGTLVLIAHLNDNELAQQVELDKPRSDIIAKQGDANLVREDRKPPFNVGTDVPQDYSLRSYCEMLYARSPLMKMQIYIAEKIVELRCVEDMCEPREMVSYVEALEVKGETHKLEVKLGFSPDACTRGVCGFFVYFDKGHQLPPRLISAYHRVGLMTNRAGKVNGMVGEVILSHKAVKVDQGKQRFEYSATLKAVDSILNSCCDLYEEAYQLLRDQHDALMRDLEERAFSQGRIVWAQYTNQGPFRHWPGIVLNRYDREVMRYMPSELFQPSNPNAFPRGPHPSHLLVECLETREKMWCKVSDLEPFDSDKGEKMEKEAVKSVESDLKESLKAAIKQAKKVLEEYDDVIECSIRCHLCTAWRTFRGSRADAEENDWECSMGYIVDGETRFDCDLPSTNKPRGQSHGLLKDRPDKKPVKAETTIVKSESVAVKVERSNGDERKESLLRRMPAKEFLSLHSSLVHKWESVSNVSVMQDGRVRTLSGVWRKNPVKIKEYKHDNFDEFLKNFQVMNTSLSHRNIISSLGVLHNDVEQTFGLMISSLPSVKLKISNSQLDASLTVRLDVMERVCMALAYLHQHDLFLSNLSWESVLLGTDNHPFISDFSPMQEASAVLNLRWEQLPTNSRAVRKGGQEQPADTLLTRRLLMLVDLEHLGAFMHCVGYGREPDVNLDLRLDLDEDGEYGPLKRHDKLLDLITDCLYVEEEEGEEGWPRGVEDVLNAIRSIHEAKTEQGGLEELLEELHEHKSSSDRSFLCYKVLDAQDLYLLRDTSMKEGLFSSCFGCQSKLPHAVAAFTQEAAEPIKSSEVLLVRDWKLAMWKASSVERANGFLPLVLVVDLRKLRTNSSFRVCDERGQLLKPSKVLQSKEKVLLSVKRSMVPQAMVDVWDWRSKAYKEFHKAMEGSRSRLSDFDGWSSRVDLVLKDKTSGRSTAGKLLEGLESDPSCDLLKKLQEVIAISEGRWRKAFHQLKAGWTFLQLGSNRLLVGEFDQRTVRAERVAFAMNLFARDHIQIGFNGSVERDSSLCIVYLCYQHMGVTREGGRGAWKKLLIALSDIFLLECIRNRKLFIHRDKSPRGPEENVWLVLILIVMMRLFKCSLKDAQGRWRDKAGEGEEEALHPLHLLILQDIEQDLKSGSLTLHKNDRRSAYLKAKELSQPLLQPSKRRAPAPEESRSPLSAKKSKMTHPVPVTQQRGEKD
ncbi:hypothetical protein GUITHDRAFT_115285 [Guillardia theta CCMP2712]|uniref:Protein kinase domain-containing protein n=3 Tax=Guillardia theta TaxID=55529 RepID=L1IRQ0_GUITC|nr:hypothetical protein GUITHDRAFT_115285 [Guillardia theta CCMP2712]EKX38505.1 hypothetical protein GUITHDRAFT_115285 [Guillardia theta CCMP2712]|eukprot:XP_005825485.1 hypothetical protein GUITHDRAFT_115285 [Guillardia theta CCMP2712]